MSYAIKVDNLDKIRSEFVKAPRVVAGQLEKGVKEAGAVILEKEKSEAPIKTGTLRRSIEMSYRPIGVTIYPKSGYAYFVHFGTGLYGERRAMIVPKRAKMLAWKSGGKMIFAKAVRGQKANAFVERTADQVGPKINRVFDNILKNISETI